MTIGSPNPIVWSPLSSPSPSDAIKTGQFYLPVDRKSEGLILMSANVFHQNIVLVGAPVRTWPPPTKRSGGFIAFRKGKVVASLPTPLNGLATDKPFKRGICSPAQAARSQARHGLHRGNAANEVRIARHDPYYRICTKGLAYMTEDRFELAELVV